MINPIQVILNNRNIGELKGIPSFCSANPFVIEAVCRYAKEHNTYALIESTANQVNQYGGYSGMTPYDFRDFVYTIADNVQLPHKMIVLGGDHLGPLVWSNLPEAKAMENAQELLKQCVDAGYKKIHLDTSMYLADDDKTIPLPTQTIANRGAALYQICMAEFKKLLDKNPNEMPIVYVIGSEVPIPGGNFKTSSKVDITSVVDFEKTILEYQKAFSVINLHKVWESIIAVVVQPGVEFGTSGVIQYESKKASTLMTALSKYPGLVFEGHSTDYQSYKSLNTLVNDGVAILKVGPALTFAVRSALFDLVDIENRNICIDKRSNFKEILDMVMIENPTYWNNYYHGSEEEIAYDRKYSILDRCRYYLSDNRVEKSINILLNNIDNISYLNYNAHDYVIDNVKKEVEKYYGACGFN